MYEQWKSYRARLGSALLKGWGASEGCSCEFMACAFGFTLMLASFFVILGPMIDFAVSHDSFRFKVLLKNFSDKIL